jgi:hypothetical protein
MQPAWVDRWWGCAAGWMPVPWRRLCLLALLCAAAAPANALTVSSISASANCDAVTGMTLTGASGAAMVTDGSGVQIAWIGPVGPFVSFGRPDQ